MKKPKLIPPDLKHCQRMILSGAWPSAEHMMEIGPRQSRPCGVTPVAVVHEIKPAEDGLIGSMALCKPCLELCLKQFPSGYLRVEKIAKARSKP